MALTRDDLQAIGEVVSALIDKQVRPLVKEEVQGAITGQNKFIAQNFADLKEVMKQSYVSREEFEQVRDELQNEVDDLRKEINQLKQGMHTT